MHVNFIIKKVSSVIILINDFNKKIKEKQNYHDKKNVD
jgi:hypothetical protein